jgi:hypothetical protein
MKRFLAGAFVLAIATPAAASKEYPDVLKKALNVSTLPVAGDGCQMCHKDDNGGEHTINKRFGTTLESFGLKSQDPNSLIGALRLDQAQGSDSDGDGVPDVQEIQAGTNPSVPNGVGDAAAPLDDSASLLPLVQTGCAIPRHSTRDVPGTAAAILFAIGGLCRRRGRAPRVNNRVAIGVEERRER